MRLSDVCESRDNNFNLIRVIAATAVLLSHSFPLSSAALDDPLIDLIGMSAGNIAVDVFFLSSGFLVTRSLLMSSSIKAFLRARALRIYPALWVMLLLTIFILGPLITESKTIDYFTDPMTWKYLYRNATMLLPAKYELPGLFLENPYGRAVNGSLWTLPFEIKLYILLAILMRGFTRKSVRNLHLFKKTTVALACILIGFQILDHFMKFDDGDALRLSGFFFSGGAFYLLRNRITLSHQSMYLLAAGLGLSLAVNHSFFFVTYSLCFTWFVLHLVYLPKGIVRKYNRLGDYSYGIYIYAFPVQQLLISIFPELSTLKFTIYSLTITIALAIFSWHQIEKSVLRLK